VKQVFLLLFILSLSVTGRSQSLENATIDSTFYRHQVELRHDNDFLIFTDRYYTAGSFIEYRYEPKQSSTKNRKEHILLGFEHYFYTPSNVISADTSNLDRPYAGYLGIKAGSFIAFESSAVDFTFTLGVTGPISMAEGFQKWFHNSTPSKIPLWNDQIKNNVHFNLYGGYIKEWRLFPKPFAVYAAVNPKLAIGTQNLYLEQGFKFFFGKRNSLARSMAYHQLGETEKEFFFSINFAYRYVFYNALLEGYPIKNKSEFTVNANNELFLYGIEGYYRTKRNDFKLGYQYISKESSKALWHLYTVISIARRF